MTRANDTRPTRRVVESRSGPLVVEMGVRTVTLRPLGSRSPAGRVTLAWGSLYVRAIAEQVARDRPTRRR